MVQYIINLKVDLINPKAITENSKQSYINNPTKDIKWNKKHSINPKEGKKKKKGTKNRWDKQKTNIKTDLNLTISTVTLNANKVNNQLKDRDR